MIRFLGLDFKTTKRTFLPRPETELLVEICKSAVSKLSSELKLSCVNILDVGTGVGNIAISLTMWNKICKITALDISELALSVARENAETYGVSDRITFVNSHIYNNITQKKDFEIIVSNPPYIPSWEIPTLAKSVREEPKIALDGGEDGLVISKAIVKDAPYYIKKGGYLIMEIGYNQSYHIKYLLSETGFDDIEIFRDFSNIERVVKARWISS